MAQRLSEQVVEWLTVGGDKYTPQTTVPLWVQGRAIFGTTTAKNTNTNYDSNLLTINGHMVIEPSYNSLVSYNQGLRINRDSQGRSAIILGGEQGSLMDTGRAVWYVGAQSTPNDATTASGGITNSVFTIRKNGNEAEVNTASLRIDDAGVTSGHGLGILNIAAASGAGLSLYGGATSGLPTYGMAFAGTGTYGTHGSIAANDWATYFTMSDTPTRGWIFKRGSTNVASIDGSGNAVFDGNATVNKTIYFGTGCSATTGKSVLGFNPTYPDYGMWYFDKAVDVLTLSASGNADSETDADFAINVHGAGTLATRNKRIPHTGNTTGTVGASNKPVYVNAGAITEIDWTFNAGVDSGTVNRVAYYSGATQVRSAANLVTDGNYLSNMTYLTVNGNHQTTHRLYVNGSARITSTLDLNSDLNLYASSADSPDIVWWYGNKSKEQARIWMGSGGTTKWAPLYRCYNPDGTQLYSGNLVLGDGTGASGTWSISISGNAATASMPLGFSSNSQSSAGWGNQTGTGVTTWNDSSGGSIEFRKDNPSGGKLSIKVDGRFYGNEGNKPAMLMTNANSYWGMGDPDGNDTVWVRTTNQGIIPYQGGGVMDGHQYLGTSSWYFGQSYITRMYTHQVIVQGTVPGATMNAGEDHPRITFQENTGTQPVHLMYSDWDSYRAPAGLKIIGDASATPAWLEVEGSIYNESIVSRKITIINGAASDSAGWKRACKIYSHHDYGNCLMFLTGGWNNGAPTMATISIHLRNNQANMKVIHTGFTGRITDIRLVPVDTTNNPNQYWLEFYLIATDNQTSNLYADFLGNIDISDIKTGNPAGSGTACAQVNINGVSAVDVRNGTATYMAYYNAANTLTAASWARMIDGCLNLYPVNNNYREGMRIHPVGSWSDITLQGDTNSGNTAGISSEDWFIGNNNGTFWITRGTSGAGVSYIRSASNKWYVNTTSGAEALNVGGWVGTVGSNGWYSVTHGGGWYMTDSKWIRNYASKPLDINIGANNGYGIGGHRTAAVFRGDSHVSIQLTVNSTLGYGLAANSNGNFYFGKFTNGNTESSSGSSYILYANTTFLSPSNASAVNLGLAATPFSNLYLGKTDGSGIYYTGTKATYRMISFIDNTGDANGNGIVIGGGGQTIIGGGESASTQLRNQATTNGAEIMWIGNDNTIDFYPDLQNGYDASNLVRITASRLWAGVNGNTTREAQVGVQSGAGQIYMYSTAPTTGTRGIYLPAGPSGGSAFSFFDVNASNVSYAHADRLGIRNTSPSTGYGLSLYNGQVGGMPTYGISFAGTATFGTHGNVTSDWATYFTMSDTANRGWIFRRGSTNVASISGNGQIYLGWAASSSNPGLYWNPYVESATDASDAAGIWQIKAGVAGGTELRISQLNDAADVINICSPYYIYLNSKKAFTINDSWLRINDGGGFTSGIYCGTSIVRTDNQLQVGSAGANFYANSSGNGYFSNTLGVHGTNTGYNFYLNGTANHVTGYWYINGGAGGIINGAATNGGINTFRMGDDVWLGDCNAGGIMGMKSTGANCGLYFYNSSGTNIGQLYARGGSGDIYSSKPFLAPSIKSSWIDGQRYEYGGYNLADATDTGSYWPWLRQTNTSSAKWFSFGILANSFYWIGSATNRTDNGYDAGMHFDLSTNRLYATFEGRLYGGSSYVYDRTNTGTATYLNYGASGLAASAITWLCCWNGYEIRAISKAEIFNAIRDNGGDGRWVKKAGDTMTGQLYINYDQDVGLNQNGSLIIGTKAGGNLSFDSNEIMARNNSAASTLYINNEGGLVQIGGGGLDVGGRIRCTGSYIWASTYVQATQHMYMDTGHFYMKYNGTWYNVLHNHGNGNTSLNAQSGGLYIGYQNTTLMNWLNGKMTLSSAGALYTASTLTTGSSITANNGSITATAGAVWSGTTSQTSEKDVGARASAGTIYLYSAGASTGNRGLYTANNAGTGASVITINQSNGMTFHGNAATATKLATMSNSTTFYRGDGAWSNAIANHWNPTANNSYDLGATGTRWRALYLTSQIRIGPANTDASSNNQTYIGAGTIELAASTPYIDFKNNTGADYNARIIASASGVLYFPCYIATSKYGTGAPSGNPGQAGSVYFRIVS